VAGDFGEERAAPSRLCPIELLQNFLGFSFGNYLSFVQPNETIVQVPVNIRKVRYYDDGEPQLFPNIQTASKLPAWWQAGHGSRLVQSKICGFLASA